MLLIVGYIVVIAGCLVGFTMAGGHAAHLIVASEIVTLGGITGGMLLIATSPAGVKAMVGSILGVLKGGSVQKKDAEDLLKLLYGEHRLLPGNDGRSNRRPTHRTRNPVALPRVGHGPPPSGRSVRQRLLLRLSD